MTWQDGSGSTLVRRYIERSLNVGDDIDRRDDYRGRRDTVREGNVSVRGRDQDGHPVYLHTPTCMCAWCEGQRKAKREDRVARQASDTLGSAARRAAEAQEPVASYWVDGVDGSTNDSPTDRTQPRLVQPQLPRETARRTSPGTARDGKNYDDCWTCEQRAKGLSRALDTDMEDTRPDPTPTRANIDRLLRNRIDLERSITQAAHRRGVLLGMSVTLALVSIGLLLAWLVHEVSR